MFTVLLFFRWICRRESDLPVLFLCHLYSSPCLLNSWSVLWSPRLKGGKTRLCSFYLVIRSCLVRVWWEPAETMIVRALGSVWIFAERIFFSRPVMLFRYLEGRKITVLYFSQKKKKFLKAEQAVLKSGDIIAWYSGNF